MAQTKQQKEAILLLALLLVAGAVWYFYFGQGTASKAPVWSQAGDYAPINAVDYSAVFGDLESARSTEYKSSGRNIFVATAEPVIAANNAAAVNLKPKRPNIGPQPKPEDPPPQLSMKFFGYGNLPSGGPRQAFLLDGDDVKIVSEGDVVANHIRITHIGNEHIEYEDTVTGKRNQNPLEQGPAT